MRLIDADAIPWDVEGVGFIPVIGKDEIDEMPTVDAEPVRHGYDTWEGRVFHCSICEYDVFDIFEHNENAYVYERGGEWNYCPNCGAKMDGERRKDEAD